MIFRELDVFELKFPVSPLDVVSLVFNHLSKVIDIVLLNLKLSKLRINPRGPRLVQCLKHETSERSSNHGCATAGRVTLSILTSN